MDLKEIQNLIKFVAKSGTSEVKLETDDFKITIKTGPTGESTVQQLVTAPATQLPAATVVPTRGAPSPRIKSSSTDCRGLKIHYN